MTTTAGPRTPAREHTGAPGPAPGAAPGGAPRPLAVTTALLTAAVAAAGLVPALAAAVAGWLTAGTGPVSAAAEVGTTLWLVGHGARPVVDGVALGLVPLGVPLLVLLAARAGGRWAVRTSPHAADGHAVGAVLVPALAYGALACLLAAVTVPEQVVLDPVRTGLVAALPVAAGLALGVAPGQGWTDRLLGLLPPVAGPVASGAWLGLRTALGAAALVAVVMVGVHLADVRSLGAGLGPGAVGGALLVLTALLVAPNGVLWTVAYLLGPGFAVGVGTSVSAAGVTLGPLPAYPLLAALPPPGDQPGWVVVLLALPVLAGVVGGVRAQRRDVEGPWWQAPLLGAAAGAAAGLVLGPLTLLSGGAIGPGRMAATGPDASVAVLAVGALALGGAIGALAARLLPGLPLPTVTSYAALRTRLSPRNWRKPAADEPS